MPRLLPQPEKDVGRTPQMKTAEVTAAKVVASILVDLHLIGVKSRADAPTMNLMTIIRAVDILLRNIVISTRNHGQDQGPDRGPEQDQNLGLNPHILRRLQKDIAEMSCVG